MELRKVTGSEWAAAVATCTKSSVYQDPRWLTLIEAIYPGLLLHRLACHDDRGMPCWFLPLVEMVPLGRRKPMLISLPFGNYGGFLLPPGHAQVNTEAIVPLRQFFTNSGAFALELREIEPPVYGLPVDQRFKRFELVFPGSADALWQQVISGNARTSVRKAEKAGVVAVHGDPDATAIFQRIYEKNASYHGTPIHHVFWYSRLRELFDRESEIVLGRIGDRFVGALWILHYQGKSVLHAAVTDPAFRQVPVTDKLLWSTLQRLATTGESMSFDFGRTRPVPGKLFFKRKWGGTEHPIYYSSLLAPGETMPALLPDNPKLARGIKAWRLLPMPVKRFVGPYLRARIPS